MMMVLIDKNACRTHIVTEKKGFDYKSPSLPQ